MDWSNIFEFNNTYSTLPDVFFERISPPPVQDPKLIRLNLPLLNRFSKFPLSHCAQELAPFFSGNSLFNGSTPLAQAYAGHQFGHFVPQLGDGRAILLGEIISQKENTQKENTQKENKRFDIQLKGTGPTRFSRRGDGRAALGPVVREYILSHAMNALNIPTTQSLAFVTTGETVYRDTFLPGAILTRIASSHIRIGTFEYFAARKDIHSLELLTQYSIQRHYPELEKITSQTERTLAFFRAVILAQAELIWKWMNVGFIHGVMNTDNTTISGETIDYGPCAFMDEYHSQSVFSSIDSHGRYSFSKQAEIIQWNLGSLGHCLSFLLPSDSEKSELKNTLSNFQKIFSHLWLEGMLTKIGLTPQEINDQTLLDQLLKDMESNHADFTLTFYALTELAHSHILEPHTPLSFLPIKPLEFVNQSWLEEWKKRLQKENESQILKMKTVNPLFIPRNHLVEKAIKDAYQFNFEFMDLLIETLRYPFKIPNESDLNLKFILPPTEKERVLETFCGT